MVGVSSVVHGADTWFEMRCDVSKPRMVLQVIVDAFAAKPYSGNPAAVCFSNGELDGWFEGDVSHSGISFAEDAKNNRGGNGIGGGSNSSGILLKGDEWMRVVAAENNLSETAFLRRRSPSGSLHTYINV